MKKKTNFTVYTISDCRDNGYEHWAKELSVVIIKNGVRLELSSEEIQEVVKSLPRTVGGSY